MRVKSDIAAVENIGSETLASLPALDLLEMRGTNQSQEIYGNFKQLVVQDRALPYRPDHEDQIISTQMLQHPANENLGQPRFFLGSAEFGYRDQIEFGTFAGFALDRKPYVPDKQVVGRLVTGGWNHRERRVHVLESNLD